jgi:1,4-dihydroxy-2-naphthoyl-CoA hydrolase
VDEFVTTGLDKMLGLTYPEVSSDRVVIRWPVTPDQHQPSGIVHGGVYCSVVESAASVGAAMWFGDRGKVVGVSNHTDFIRAASSGTMTAVATPVHRGRSQQLWLVEITDEQGRLIARGQVRLQNLTDPA